MFRKICQDEQKRFIESRKNHFQVSVKDAPETEKNWGTEVIFTYGTDGIRKHSFRLSYDEAKRIVETLSEWLDKRNR
jgi:hypothetical protein